MPEGICGKQIGNFLKNDACFDQNIPRASRVMATIAGIQNILLKKSKDQHIRFPFV